mmetsp:Transcript_96625/g.256785  ORF Transcript_96625/g.256785 Transcript_96625/m.256785 type:complete len:271 (+) Transcript_96625:146-958(+)
MQASLMLSSTHPSQQLFSCQRSARLSFARPILRWDRSPWLNLDSALLFPLGLSSTSFCRLVVDLLQEMLEGVLHVVGRDGARLSEQELVLARKLTRRIKVDLARCWVFLHEVDLVANEHDDYVWLRVLPQLLEPLQAVLKCGLPGHVVHKKCPYCSAIVGAGDGAVPLLACCVPDLRLHRPTNSERDSSCCKLDADGGSGRLRQGPLHVAGEQVRLSDGCITDKDHLVEVVAGLLAIVVGCHCRQERATRACGAVGDARGGLLSGRAEPP